MTREEWAARWWLATIPELVMDFVFRRGYGAWYASDAWREIATWPPMPDPYDGIDWFIYDYLDERYPSVLAEGVK